MSESDVGIGDDGVRASGGPLRGFEAFFEAEHERLLRAVFLMTGNVAEAEDLAQETFLRVWERWDRVRKMENPTGYLYRIAMNLFRSRLRRVARAAKRVAGLRGDALDDAFADPAAVADDRDAIMRALAGLAPRQRAAVVVTELLGYGSEDAGRILGVRASTVRALASQGRAALKERLGDE